MKEPVRVSITGAAGNIGYALCFRIAAGDMLGPDQPVILQLIEIPPAMEALVGVVDDRPRMVARAQTIRRPSDRGRGQPFDQRRG